MCSWQANPFQRGLHPCSHEQVRYKQVRGGDTLDGDKEVKMFCFFGKNVTFKEHERNGKRLFHASQSAKGSHQERRQLTKEKQIDRARLIVRGGCRAMVFKLGPEGPWEEWDREGARLVGLHPFPNSSIPSALYIGLSFPQRVLLQLKISLKTTSLGEMYSDRQNRSGTGCC